MNSDRTQRNRDEPVVERGSQAARLFVNRPRGSALPFNETLRGYDFTVKCEMDGKGAKAQARNMSVQQWDGRDATGDDGTHLRTAEWSTQHNLWKRHPTEPPT